MSASATGPSTPPSRRNLRPSGGAVTEQSAAGKQHTLWAKTKDKSKQSWDSLYKVADKVGYWSNAKAAKIGTEGEHRPACVNRSMRALTGTNPEHAPLETIGDTKKAQQRVLHKIPTSVFEQAQGVAIFTVFRTGFLVSGSGGSGIVLARDGKGGWTAPSGILLHTIGFGFLAGIDVYDVVLILRTRAAVDAFTHPRVSLGAELGVTAGPLGAGHVLETSIDRSPSPVWAYTKSKGAYVGVALEGTVFIERNDENARSYGREIKATEILAGQVKAPTWAEALHQTLSAASGQCEFPNLPQTEYASHSARRLPQSPLDDSDLAELEKLEATLHAIGIEDGAINEHNRQSDPCMVKGDELEDWTKSPKSFDSSPKVSTVNEVKRRSVPPPPPVPPRRTPRTATPELGHDKIGPTEPDSSQPEHGLGIRVDDETV
ncbi:hypothetical protein OIV83_000611 [Microbotryomycetes sp. JL201]|nr:hypothetical protein OIV83_000611 [Microbotryomycetes sp. JL201]